MTSNYISLITNSKILFAKGRRRDPGQKLSMVYSNSSKIKLQLAEAVFLGA
jgi:hypothetical protein